MLGRNGLGLSAQIRLYCLRGAWVLLLLLAIRLEDRQTRRAQAEYDHADQLFQSGRMAQSQQEAEEGFRRFQGTDRAWAAKFQRLVLECMLYRGLNEDVLRALSTYVPDPGDQEATIWKLSAEGYVYANKGAWKKAAPRLAQAGKLCSRYDFQVCGDMLQSEGILEVMQGHHDEGQQELRRAAVVARAHHDRREEIVVLLTLGWANLIAERLDEAEEWLSLGYRQAVELGAEDLAESAASELASVYLMLGDQDKALALSLDAQMRAERLGITADDWGASINLGSAYEDAGDTVHAEGAYRHALQCALQIGSTWDVMGSYQSLANLAVSAGKLEDAKRYVDLADAQDPPRAMRAMPFQLTKGKLAAALHQDGKAKAIFLALKDKPKAFEFIHISAGLELAHMLERQGRRREAEKIYKESLTVFETSHARISSSENRLSYMSAATSLYEGYIDLLVRQGRTEDALAVADSSRAQALAQGLGVSAEQFSFRHTGWDPRQVAKKTGATLLFYWLGKEHSYIWAIDEHRISLVRRPRAAEVSARVDRYRQALAEKQDPLKTDGLCHQYGRDLYDLLVSPAAKRIKPGGRVMILADGVLSRLNFETLLAPGPAPSLSKTPARPTPAEGRLHDAHYWIEDAVLASAPSLSLLAAAKPDSGSGGRILLAGDAVSPSPEYPALPLAGMEMKLVQNHFDAGRRTVISREKATPAAYLGSSPSQFAYIHFVTHGTASTTAPLESAIILSRQGGAAPYQESPFKLYARDIVQHAVDARLVTITACYGSGARTYTGEGLVGLAWAFLRAGAHNVIGALWEVSDESTPRLMDGLYTGLDAGLDPAAALRNSKLALLHSNSSYRAPFFWAGFEIYTGH